MEGASPFASPSKTLKQKLTRGTRVYDPSEGMELKTVEELNSPDARSTLEDLDVEEYIAEVALLVEGSGDNASRNWDDHSELEEERVRRKAPGALRLGVAGRHVVSSSSMPQTRSKLLDSSSVNSQYQALPSMRLELKALFTDDGTAPEASTKKVLKTTAAIVAASMVVMVVLVLALLRNERRDEFNEIDARVPESGIEGAVDPETATPILHEVLRPLPAYTRPLAAHRPHGTGPPELPPSVEQAIRNLFPDLPAEISATAQQAPAADIIFPLGHPNDASTAAEPAAAPPTATDDVVGTQPAVEPPPSFSRVGLDRAEAPSQHAAPSGSPTEDHSLSDAARDWKAKLNHPEPAATGTPLPDTASPIQSSTATHGIASDAVPSLDDSGRQWRQQHPIADGAGGAIPMGMAETERHLPV